MTDLHDAVNALTDPTVFADILDRRTIPGDLTAGEDYRAMVTRPDPSLLAQLHDARVPSTARSGGSSNRQRINVAANAADLENEIRERLDAWLLELGNDPGWLGGTLTTTELLTRWHRLVSAPGVVLDHEAQRVRVLVRWATEIRDLVEAPDEYTYNEACPLCGSTRSQWFDAGQKVEGAALRAVIRGPWREEGSFGECRSCREVLATVDMGESDSIRATAVLLRFRMNTAIETGRARTNRMTQTIAEAIGREQEA